MYKKLKTEVDEIIARRAFDMVRGSSNVFDRCSKRTIQRIANHSKILSFKKGEQLARKGEKIDYFGILLSGSLLVQQYGDTYALMSAGEMIGYMTLCDLKG